MGGIVAYNRVRQTSPPLTFTDLSPPGVWNTSRQGLGWSTNVQSSLSGNPAHYDITLSLGWNGEAGRVAWAKGPATMDQPVFHISRINTMLRVAPSVWSLWPG